MFVLHLLSLLLECELQHRRDSCERHGPRGSRRNFPTEKNKFSTALFLPVNYPPSKRVASFHQSLLLIKSVVVAVIYESGIIVDWFTRVASNWVTLNR